MCGGKKGEEAQKGEASKDVKMTPKDKLDVSIIIIWKLTCEIIV
jgi:hypothetical protein